jgi:hypothetical protein
MLTIASTFPSPTSRKPGRCKSLPNRPNQSINPFDFRERVQDMEVDVNRRNLDQVPRHGIQLNVICLLVSL